MTRLTHVYEPGVTYLITAVTHRREKLFAESNLALVAHTDIDFYANKFSLASVAHVIMPDHFHWIIWPSPDDFERFSREEIGKGDHSKYGHAPERSYLSKILEDYKRHVSHAVNTQRAMHGAKMWQAGFRDDALRTPQAIRAAVQYVVMNPVKAGLVDQSEDYPFMASNSEWLI